MMRLGNNGRVAAPAAAFSLVEMLTVIAIIAIIAAIVLGVMPGVMQKKTMARVQTELTQLQAAIEYYKEKHGFYPPDNPTNAAQAPLFYELIGSRVEQRPGGTLYFPLNNEPRMVSTLISNVFGGAINGYNGFLNSADDAGEVKNFYPTIRRTQYQGHPDNTNVMFLVVPAKGPGETNYNPWRYVVAKASAGANESYPTNNPGSFDLWAEVGYGGRTNKIGNWKK